MPVVVLTGLSEARKRAYLLFDNKIAEHSTYDWPALANELQGLSELLAADGLDFELTGFNAAELDALTARLLDDANEPDDNVPPSGAQAVTRRGDIWVFNKKHRLLCDDSRIADYAPHAWRRRIHVFQRSALQSQDSRPGWAREDQAS